MLIDDLACFNGNGSCTLPYTISYMTNKLFLKLLSITILASERINPRFVVEVDVLEIGMVVVV